MTAVRRRARRRVGGRPPVPGDPARAAPERGASPVAVALGRCTGCGACAARCAPRAIALETELPGGFGAKRARVDPARCTACGACVVACPHGAMVIRWP